VNRESLQGHAEASYRAADGEVAATVEKSPWNTIADSTDAWAFAAAWLPLLSRSFPAIAQSALFLSLQGGKPLECVGRWGSDLLTPERTKVFALGADQILSAVLKDRRGAVAPGSSADLAYAAYPIVLEGSVGGVVVAEATVSDELAARRVLRHLQWGSAWAEAFLRRQSRASNLGVVDRAATLLEIVTAVAAERRLVDACRVLASLLARTFSCERVSCGLLGRHSVRMVAMANQATFDRKSRQARAVEAAMNEAIDQHAILELPHRSQDSHHVTAAHEALLAEAGSQAALTMPLMNKDVAIGAVTLEKTTGAPFQESDIDVIDALCALAAPVIADKKANDRPLLLVALDRARSLGEMLLGPGHAARKVAVVAAIAIIGFLVFAKGEYRATAKGQIQGEMRRLIGAPFDGYIKAQYARAGEIVRADALLAELEDHDLTLDRLRLLARRRQYQLELERALSKREIAAANIAQAQITQTDAEIELADQMLARTRIKAPYDSVVVSGDLSQSIGRPVSRGDTLFELAPLDRYRVTAIVPESDIQAIEPGQKGHLLLAAVPEEQFDVVLTTVTPVAQVADGVNGFEVIGSISQHDSRIRPGMEGIAKISIGPRPLVWIWTHEFLHWLRIKIWTWLP
jgi:hypothetical protein